MSNNTLNLAMSAMLVGGLAFVSGNAAQAFQLTDMHSGYQLVGDEADKSKEGSCGEGKCGAAASSEDDKSAEGSCGGDKSKEGNCGEGKCGGEAKKEGEGSCGGNAV